MCALRDEEIARLDAKVKRYCQKLEKLIVNRETEKSKVEEKLEAEKQKIWARFEKEKKRWEEEKKEIVHYMNKLEHDLHKKGEELEVESKKKFSVKLQLEMREAEYTSILRGKDTKQGRSSTSSSDSSSRSVGLNPLDSAKGARWRKMIFVLCK